MNILKRGDFMAKVRNPNIFETIVLLIGVILILVGYAFIYKQIAVTGMTWDAIQAIFLWMILLALLIIMSVNENVKEELKQLIELEIEETKLLRKVVQGKGLKKK